LPTLTDLLSVFVATKEILEIADGFPLVKYIGRLLEPAFEVRAVAVAALPDKVALIVEGKLIIKLFCPSKAELALPALVLSASLI